MNLILRNKHLSWNHLIFPCAWGYGGIRNSKQEGDGVTPFGCFPFRRVFYRADRIEKPDTSLPLKPLTPQDGWCDDPNDPLYNQYITLPYEASHEELWRKDHLYDIILVVGYNDDPIVKGKGSAIFVHLSSSSYDPTAGCVAFALPHLLTVLKEASAQSNLVIQN